MSPLLRGASQSKVNTTLYASAGAGDTSGTAKTFTGSAAIGDYCFAAHAGNASGISDVMSMVDSASNTWVKQVQRAGTTVVTSLWTCKLTAAITGGTTTFTITNSSGVTNVQWFLWSVASPAWASTIVNDGTNSVTNTSTAPNCGSVTPTNAPNYVVAVVGSAGGGAGSPNAGGLTELSDSISPGGVALQVNELIYNSKAALSPSETITTSSVWSMLQSHHKWTGVGRVPQNGFLTSNARGAW